MQKTDAKEPKKMWILCVLRKLGSSIEQVTLLIFKFALPNEIQWKDQNAESASVISTTSFEKDTHLNVGISPARVAWINFFKKPVPPAKRLSRQARSPEFTKTNTSCYAMRPFIFSLKYSSSQSVKNTMIDTIDTIFSGKINSIDLSTIRVFLDCNRVVSFIA